MQYSMLNKQCSMDVGEILNIKRNFPVTQWILLLINKKFLLTQCYVIITFFCFEIPYFNISIFVEI